MTSNCKMPAVPDGQIPRHVAIVMDGNGRWAQKRGLPRYQGHIQGASILENVVHAAIHFGIDRLTLYCFSSENWKRPSDELNALMTLLREYMIEQRPLFMKNNVRLRIIGRRDRLPAETLKEMNETVRLTESNTGLTLALAINYGARQEIVDAVRRIVGEMINPEKRNAALKRAGVDAVEDLVDENMIAKNLYDGDAPDPDLFIRTGGEQRLSNYLLWQLSYSELWFTHVLWPDFTPETLKEGIVAFQSRHRRFGGLKINDSDVQ